MFKSTLHPKSSTLPSSTARHFFRPSLSYLFETNSGHKANAIVPSPIQNTTPVLNRTHDDVPNQSGGRLSKSPHKTPIVIGFPNTCEKATHNQYFSRRSPGVRTDDPHGEETEHGAASGGPAA